jgi:hypothetical protein
MDNPVAGQNYVSEAQQPTLAVMVVSDLGIVKVRYTPRVPHCMFLLSNWDLLNPGDIKVVSKMVAK